MINKHTIRHPKNISRQHDYRIFHVNSPNTPIGRWGLYKEELQNVLCNDIVDDEVDIPHDPRHMIPIWHPITDEGLSDLWLKRSLEDKEDIEDWECVLVFEEASWRWYKICLFNKKKKKILLSFFVFGF